LYSSNCRFAQLYLAAKADVAALYTADDASNSCPNQRQVLCKAVLSSVQARAEQCAVFVRERVAALATIESINDGVTAAIADGWKCQEGQKLVINRADAEYADRLEGMDLTEEDCLSNDTALHSFCETSSVLEASDAVCASDSRRLDDCKNATTTEEDITNTSAFDDAVASATSQSRSWTVSWMIFALASGQVLLGGLNVNRVEMHTSPRFSGGEALPWKSWM